MCCASASLREPKKNWVSKPRKSTFQNKTRCANMRARHKQTDTNRKTKAKETKLQPSIRIATPFLLG